MKVQQPQSKTSHFCDSFQSYKCFAYLPVINAASSYLIPEARHCQNIWRWLELRHVRSCRACHFNPYQEQVFINIEGLHKILLEIGASKICVVPTLSKSWTFAKQPPRRPCGGPRPCPPSSLSYCSSSTYKHLARCRWISFNIHESSTWHEYFQHEIPNPKKWWETHKWTNRIS